MNKQIFVKKLSESALVINNTTYNLPTMSEEELLELSQLLDDLRKEQVKKVSTAALIHANTQAKKPVMQEITATDSEKAKLEFKFKKKFHEKELTKYSEKLEVAHKNLKNARKKKEILQELIMLVGFAFIEAEKMEEPTIFMRNVLTGEHKYVGAREAAQLEMEISEYGDNIWTYNSEIYQEVA